MLSCGSLFHATYSSKKKFNDDFPFTIFKTIVLKPMCNIVIANSPFVIYVTASMMVEANV